MKNINLDLGYKINFLFVEFLVWAKLIDLKNMIRKCKKLLLFLLHNHIK